MSDMSNLGPTQPHLQVQNAPDMSGPTQPACPDDVFDIDSLFDSTVAKSACNQQERAVLQGAVAESGVAVEQGELGKNIVTEGKQKEEMHVANAAAQKLVNIEALLDAMQTANAHENLCTIEHVDGKINFKPLIQSTLAEAEKAQKNGAAVFMHGNHMAVSSQFAANHGYGHGQTVDVKGPDGLVRQLTVVVLDHKQSQLLMSLIDFCVDQVRETEEQSQEKPKETNHKDRAHQKQPHTLTPLSVHDDKDKKEVEKTGVDTAATPLAVTKQEQKRLDEETVENTRIQLRNAALTSKAKDEALKEVEDQDKCLAIRHAFYSGAKSVSHIPVDRAAPAA